ASQISSARSSEILVSPKHKGRRASGISTLFKSMAKSSCAFVDVSLRKQIVAIIQSNQALFDDRLY
ncbi:MAG: hypothetical protein VX292_01820, partial [Pseudomonadota bacterium]|nr:hypothetical protein [Pseudomonadota bacterium]